jgi:hypothetical protein
LLSRSWSRSWSKSCSWRSTSSWWILRNITKPTDCSLWQWTMELAKGIFKEGHSFYWDSRIFRLCTLLCNACWILWIVFGDTVIDLLVKETNKYALRSRQDTPSSMFWLPVTRQEVETFFGLPVAMGVADLP